MPNNEKTIVPKRGDVSNFLAKVAKTPVIKSSGPVSHLLFAMDATASRESTWDRACHLQGQMFEATKGIGQLSVQLAYYRGFNEFHSSRWHESSTALLAEMSGVRCLGGYTQIDKVLQHAMKEHKQHPIRALVFVGDAVEEDADALCHLAGKMGVMQIPLFMFHEGPNAAVKSVFQQMATLSGGAYAPFDLKSADELKDLLAAVAVFATGGRKALTRFSTNAAGLLGHQIRN